MSAFTGGELVNLDEWAGHIVAELAKASLRGHDTQARQDAAAGGDVTTVVGIDPSLTNTGIAVLTDGCPTLIGSCGFGGHNSDDYPQRSRRVVAQTRTVLARVPDTGIDLVVIEGPSYGSAHGSSFDRAGLWHGVYAGLLARKLPIAVCAPQTRAKWATGHGRAQKPVILATVREWWPRQHIADDDQADAAVLAAMGALHLGCSMPFEVRERHLAGLEAVAWPEGVA